MIPTRAPRLFLIAIITLSAAACGGDSSPASPSGGNDGTVAATLTITSAGISPKAVSVPVGSRVTIVNSDTRNHNMNSDPHPEHTTCFELNTGILEPGEELAVTFFGGGRACAFHDEANPSRGGIIAIRADIVVPTYPIDK